MKHATSSLTREEPTLSVRQAGRLRLIDADLRISGSYPPTIVAFAFQATPELDEQTLKDALEDVIAQHEVLRSTFPVLDGDRTIAVRNDPDFEVVNFPEVSASQAASLIAGQTTRCFNLETGPVVRLAIARPPSGGDSVFAILADHLVIDGMGLPILLRKISQAYAARVEGKERDLNGASSDSAAFSFAQRQHELRTSAEGERRLTYWRQQ